MFYDGLETGYDEPRPGRVAMMTDDLWPLAGTVAGSQIDVRFFSILPLSESSENH